MVWLGNHLALGKWLFESSGKVKARGETENRKISEPGFGVVKVLICVERLPLTEV